MYQSKDYLPALFFVHLVLEKLCKALWVKNNIWNTLPKSHNLIKILDEANIKYSTKQEAIVYAASYIAWADYFIYSAHCGNIQINRTIQDVNDLCAIYLKLFPGDNYWVKAAVASLLLKEFCLFNWFIHFLTGFLAVPAITKAIPL